MYQLSHHMLVIAFLAGSLVAATPAFAGGDMKNKGRVSPAAATGVVWAAMHHNDSTNRVYLGHEIAHTTAHHGNAGQK